MELVHQGKVRDVYKDGAELILVASDRVSVFDRVLPTPIPDKGALLTALSLWWFEQFADLIPNHIISATDVPAEFAGRAVRVKALDMVPVEAIVRGYLTGSGLIEYQKIGSVSGIELPQGLIEASKLDTPIYTPSTKATVGDHDEAISYSQTVDILGASLAPVVRDATMTIYRRGAQIAAERGLIIADTKVEFGLDTDGTLTLADEVLTSDSSRFWDAGQWSAGKKQASFDKQIVRDWAKSTGWDTTGPAPEVPQDIVEATRAQYVTAFERLTGTRW